MRYLDVDTWNRKQHFDHFRSLKEPYFAVVVNVNVTKTYNFAKEQKQSFFALYLHKCLTAINAVENLRYRLEGDKVVIHDTIHASATIARPDTTFGFSFIHYSDDFETFNSRFEQEKSRILNSTELFPPVNTEDCIYCSALPWYQFTSHKEPVSGREESVPKLAFGKIFHQDDQILMPVSIAVNHALADGYHVGQFFDVYQQELDKIG